MGFVPAPNGREQTLTPSFAACSLRQGGEVAGRRHERAAEFSHLGRFRLISVAEESAAQYRRATSLDERECLFRQIREGRQRPGSRGERQEIRDCGLGQSEPWPRLPRGASAGLEDVEPGADPASEGAQGGLAGGAIAEAGRRPGVAAPGPLDVRVVMGSVPPYTASTFSSSARAPSRSASSASVRARLWRANCRVEWCSG